MANLQPQRISYKYDLMHRNTPSFASTVVTWDTGKLTPITKKRVITALRTGVSKFRGGDAASMYWEIRKQFEIPDFALRKPTEKKGYTRDGYVQWEFATDKLMLALDRVYKAERAIQRIENPHGLPWYLKDESIDTKKTNYFYFENNHDTTEVEAAINEIVNSPEIKDKREQAIHFVETGGKLTFTWRE